MIKFRHRPPAPSPTHASTPAPAQLAGLEDLANRGEQARHTAQLRETLDARGNQTGLPDALKSGLEQLSGHDLSPVRVRYDSPQPAQLSAHAYTRGTEIHLAPGQEQHLPHEAAHVVQQMEGRVRATTQMSGVAINDDHGLEAEADALGAAAMRLGSSGVNANDAVQRRAIPSDGVAQLQITVTGGKKPGTYDAIGAINLLVGMGLVSFKESNDLWDVIDAFDKQDRTFETPEALLQAAIKAYEGERDEDEEENEEVEDFADYPDFWQDEGEEFQQTNFKEKGYIIGESIRNNMDYETVDKDAFEVKDKPKLAMVIRLNRVKGSQPLQTEVKMLKKIGKSVPVADVIATGFYPMAGVPHPAMLMKRYLTSSKTLARSKKKGPERTEKWKKAAEVFSTPEMVKTGVKSLEMFKEYIKGGEENAIDDIQFLIDEDGSFVVNDASGQGDQEKNILLIEVLKDVLRERFFQLTGGEL